MLAVGWRMRISYSVVLFAAGASLLSGQNGPANPQSEGVRPRGQANQYATQAGNARAVLAASVLPADQVKQRFAYDISKTYVVMEVACYPGAQGPLTLRAGDFEVRLSAKSDAIYPADAPTVAAMVQRKNLPPAPGQSTPVYTEANVGYSSGTDPYTGRRVSGVYTGVGVGVGGPPIGAYPGQGGYPIDQSLLEEQLWHRGLPEGTVSKPIAGYLYFPMALLKKEKGFYLLEVRGEGQDKWELKVPLVHR